MQNNQMYKVSFKFEQFELSISQNYMDAKMFITKLMQLQVEKKKKKKRFK